MDKQLVGKLSYTKGSAEKRMIKFLRREFRKYVGKSNLAATLHEERGGRKNLLVYGVINNDQIADFLESLNHNIANTWNYSVAKIQEATPEKTIDERLADALKEKRDAEDMALNQMKVNDGLREKMRKQKRENNNQNNMIKRYKNRVKELEKDRTILLFSDPAEFIGQYAKKFNELEDILGEAKSVHKNVRQNAIAIIRTKGLSDFPIYSIVEEDAETFHLKVYLPISRRQQDDHNYPIIMPNNFNYGLGKAITKKMPGNIKALFTSFGIQVADPDLETVEYEAVSSLEYDEKNNFFYCHAELPKEYFTMFDISDIVTSVKDTFFQAKADYLERMSITPRFMIDFRPYADEEIDLFPMTIEPDIRKWLGQRIKGTHQRLEALRTVLLSEEEPLSREELNIYQEEVLGIHVKLQSTSTDLNTLKKAGKLDIYGLGKATKYSIKEE